MAASFAPKKDGGPNLKFYESPDTVPLFDALKSWLVKNCKKVRNGKRWLGRPAGRRDTGTPPPHTMDVVVFRRLSLNRVYHQSIE